MQQLLKKALLHNAGLKLGSLILAVLLWVFLQGEEQLEAFVQVSVNLRNRPENLIVTNSVPERITLSVRGRKSEVVRLQDAPPEAFKVDLRELKKGDNLFRLHPSNFVDLPKSITVSQIIPPSFNVVLDEKVRKSLPVEVNFSGKLENGFKVVRTTVIPEVVTVVGSAAEINQLRQVMTARIELDGIRKSFTQTYPLLLNASSRLWLEKVAEVEVDVKIKESIISQIIEDIEIRVQGNIGEHTLKPDKASMVVQCPAGVANDLKNDPPEVYVNVSNVDLKTVVDKNLLLRTNYQLPKRCGVLRLLPERVRLTW